MTTVQEIAEAIKALTPAEKAELAKMIRPLDGGNDGDNDRDDGNPAGGTDDPAGGGV